MLWIVLCLSVMAILPSYAQSQSTNPYRIRVDMDRPRQTITGFGGAYAFRFSKTPLDMPDRVAQVTYETLRPTHLRFDIPLDSWEPVNDNLLPFETNYEAFTIQDRAQDSIALMQRAQADGAVIYASVWDVPDWMVQNPQDERQRVLKPDMVDEFVESLTAYLVTMRDEYGVNIVAVSLNEPDYGASVLYTPNDIIFIMSNAIERFAEAGLETKWVLAETSNMTDALAHARAIWLRQSIRPEVLAWGYHSWDPDASDAILRGNAQWANTVGLETWITEVGHDPTIYLTPELFPTWDYAIQLARIYSRLYKLSGMNVPFHWQLLDDYRVLSEDGTTLYPSYHVLRLIRGTVPVGSVVVDTSTDGNGLYFFAVSAPNNITTLFVVNTADTDMPIQIDGLPPGTYRQFRLSEMEGTVELAGVAIGDLAHTDTLMASSVNIFTTLGVSGN